MSGAEAEAEMTGVRDLGEDVASGMAEVDLSADADAEAAGDVRVGSSQGEAAGGAADAGADDDERDGMTITHFYASENEEEDDETDETADSAAGGSDYDTGDSAAHGAHQEPGTGTSTSDNQGAAGGAGAGQDEDGTTNMLGAFDSAGSFPEQVGTRLAVTWRRARIGALRVGLCAALAVCGVG